MQRLVLAAALFAAVPAQAQQTQQPYAGHMLVPPQERAVPSGAAALAGALASNLATALAANEALRAELMQAQAELRAVEAAP